MILIEFENNVFPLPKQYPSENADDWKEDEIGSTHIIPEKMMSYYHQLSVEEERLKKKKCLKRCSKKNIILLMSLMNCFLK